MDEGVIEPRSKERVSGSRRRHLRQKRSCLHSSFPCWKSSQGCLEGSSARCTTFHLSFLARSLLLRQPTSPIAYKVRAEANFCLMKWKDSAHDVDLYLKENEKKCVVHRQFFNLICRFPVDRLPPEEILVQREIKRSMLLMRSIAYTHLFNDAYRDLIKKLERSLSNKDLKRGENKAKVMAGAPPESAVVSALFVKYEGKSVCPCDGLRLLLICRRSMRASCKIFETD